MRMSKVYVELSTLLTARENCDASNNHEWYQRHTDRIEKLIDDVMPRGSGFDSGRWLDLRRSKPDRLVICTSFHHMDDNGMYICWTDHDVIVKPSLAFGFMLQITGRNKRDINDYIAEMFGTALHSEIDKDTYYLGDE